VAVAVAGGYLQRQPTCSVRNIFLVGCPASNIAGLVFCRIFPQLKFYNDNYERVQVWG
jgi:hypothetical protein